MTIYDVFLLLGGLAMFLFGMHYMSESLEKRAGRKLKGILEGLTSRPIKGVLLGAGITAAIQSSSAMTVMIVGFVNAGVMQLKQAIPTVMGANVGTTITAWILSLTGITSTNFWVTLLKPATFAPLLAFIGIVLFFASRKNKNTAGVLLGFAILMFGMEQMSRAVNGLSDDPSFIRLMTLFSNPLFGVAIGAFVTAVIQSSSASVGILQAIANSGGMSYGAAVPIIMGQNIGTCVTAILSSVGAGKNAKRVAAVHLYFNLFGTAIFLVVFYLLHAVIRFSFFESTVSSFGIAVTHTTFNILTTLIMYPLMGWLERLAKKTIRGDQAEIAEVLDLRLLNTPTIAVQQCRKLTIQMAVEAQTALLQADSLLDEFSAKTAENVNALENTIDRYEDRLGSYLVQLSARGLSDGDSQEVAKLLHIIGDLERISDHAVNLTKVAAEIHDKHLEFSSEALEETKVIRNAVRHVLDLTTRAFIGNDLTLAEEIEPLEQTVDDLRNMIKSNHIKRLQQGVCTIELGFILSDLLHNLERVSDHCSNIAIVMIEIERHGKIDVHEYVRNLKAEK